MHIVLRLRRLFLSSARYGACQSENWRERGGPLAGVEDFPPVIQLASAVSLSRCSRAKSMVGSMARAILSELMASSFLPTLL